MTHGIGALLWLIFKVVLWLIVVAVGGFSVLMAGVVILGPLFQKRGPSRRESSGPINPYAETPEKKP
jgi:hypothetical protein